jgi:competence protein ComEA|nr:helix-hairpin-helix domain-containing protein [Marinobacterium sp. xm-d-530]
MAGYPVNINSADAVELADALDGIGQSKAEAIVAYRDANGPFNSVEALTAVRGIGVATVEKNVEYILLEPAKPMSE